MGRGKLSMELISNEKCRKTSFLKREKSLMRKAYELSTLCDVRTCVFVYGPSQNVLDDQSPIRVHTWPPCREDVNDMIASYKANCLHKRNRKAFGILDFFSDRKKKIEADMSKLRKDVAEARFPKWDERLDYLSEDELGVVLVELELKLDATKRRIDIITQNLEEGSSSSQTLTKVNMKQKQLIPFEDQQANIIPFQYHHQNLDQIMEITSNNIVPMLKMEHHHHHHHQFINNPHGNCNYLIQNHNFFSNPQNHEMVMDQNHPQICSMCHYHYGGSHSIMPLPLPLQYMQQLTDIDDQKMMDCANSKSQMGLVANIPSNQGNYDQQLDNYLNYEYFMNTNFSNI